MLNIVFYAAVKPQAGDLKYKKMVELSQGNHF
jgi:hypothetical protein